MVLSSVRSMSSWSWVMRFEMCMFLSRPSRRVRRVMSRIFFLGFKV